MKSTVTNMGMLIHLQFAESFSFLLEDRAHLTERQRGVDRETKISADKVWQGELNRERFRKRVQQAEINRGSLTKRD